MTSFEERRASYVSSNSDEMNTLALLLQAYNWLGEANCWRYFEERNMKALITLVFLTVFSRGGSMDGSWNESLD